jgi:hypothetical protein
MSKALHHKFGPSGPCDKGSEWAESKGSWATAEREKKGKSGGGPTGPK